MFKEKIDKILMNHWIDFKKCKCYIFIIDDNIIKMKKFVNNHQKLLQKIPKFVNSNFAQIKWLSEETWLSKNKNENIENK